MCIEWLAALAVSAGFVVLIVFLSSVLSVFFLPLPVKAKHFIHKSFKSLHKVFGLAYNDPEGYDKAPRL